MPSLRQALNHFRQHWKDSLLVGLLSVALILLSHWIPLLGGWVLSVGLLVVQFAVWHWLQEGRWPKPKAFLAQLQFLPFVISSLVLIPTSILIGSASGLLQNLGDYGLNIILSFLFFVIGIGFFFILTHALAFNIFQKEDLMKAFDKAAMAFLKNIRFFLVLCFYLGAAALISVLSRGLIFIFVMPLIYYSSFYSFKTVFATAPLKDAMEEI